MGLPAGHSFGDWIPDYEDLRQVSIHRFPEGNHVVMELEDEDDESLYQFLVDDNGGYIDATSFDESKLLTVLHNGKTVGGGVFVGHAPGELFYVDHSRDTYRIDLYVTDDSERADVAKYVVSLYRHIWPGLPVEVEALRTLTGPYSPDLLGHFEYRHKNRTYVLGTLRRLPQGVNAFEQTKQEVAAQVISHSQCSNLGQTLRYIHDSFLMAFPYEWVPAETVALRLIDRLDIFVAAAPELAPYESWIREWYEHLSGSMLVQRLHGNINLREMWIEEDSSWFIGGWEGDVRLPIEQRTLSGSPLEDLATLQRSMFWACGGNKAWCIQAMGAIFDGYGEPMMSVPFSAFVLDRACEELVREKDGEDGKPELPLAFLEWFRENALETRPQMAPSEFMR
ncbi:MAG: hypothetical protein Q4G50_01950 [Corynebacterium sp.]|uniref:hypothetical protein n=1 Tax=Corynebacterium sp. TaxID=1720 RepID=UPI0026DF3B9D|nr:hypothetical protein [Corynebacterium sp.]MDO5668745.1 hypothetical protein [Corynebacterium sp.]